MLLLDQGRTAEAARAAAMAAGDLDILADLLHDDLRYGHTSGLWDDKTEYLAKLADGRLAYPTVRSTETGSRVLGTTVLLWIDLDAEVITPAGRRRMHNACLTIWTPSTGSTDGTGGVRMLVHHPTVLPL